MIREITAQEAGYVSAIDGEALGLAVVGLGGGRQVESDVVDPAVGFSDVLPLGARVEKGTVLAVVHAGRPDQADHAVVAYRSAVQIGADQPKRPDLIHAKVG